MSLGELRVPPRSSSGALSNILNREREIIRRVLAGDTGAFEEIINLVKAHVFRIVNNSVSRQDVDEVAQEVFIRIYRDLRSYGERAPFEHWVAKIAVRSCFDYWRTQRRQRTVNVTTQELEQLESALSDVAGIENSAVIRAKELLHTALDHLAPEDRLAFTLLHLEGHSQKEVAAFLGWSVARVKIRSFRAKKVLNKILSGSLE